MPKVRWDPITFCEEEEEGILYPHDDPMIIPAEITDYDVGRVLIDTGHSLSGQEFFERQAARAGRRRASERL